MRIDIFSFQLNKVIPNKWREWRCGRRWENEKKFGLVRLVCSHC
jgi:hypothetical protein